jgi:hypothetical protein
MYLMASSLYAEKLNTFEEGKTTGRQRAEMVVLYPGKGCRTGNTQSSRLGSDAGRLESNALQSHGVAKQVRKMFPTFWPYKEVPLVKVHLREKLIA